MRLGRQAISWGESDTIALLDQTNPFDLTRGAPGIFEDIDEARIPLWTARATYNLVRDWGPVTNAFLDTYLVPGSIDTTIAQTPILRVSPSKPPGWGIDAGRQGGEPGRTGGSHAMRQHMLLRVLGLSLMIGGLVGPAFAAKSHTKILRVKLGPFRIEANRDREVCQAIRVPGVAGMEIASWEARSRISHGGTTASHHLVLYGYSGADEAKFPKGLVDDQSGCAGFGPTDFFKERVFLSGSGGESPSGKWSVTSASWPGDLAQVMPAPKDAPADTWLVVDSHYFNGAPKPGRGLVKLTLKLRPLDPRRRLIRQVIHGDASRGIMIPPGKRTTDLDHPNTAVAALRADGAPNNQTEGGANPSGDVCVFNLATHMHKRGTRFLIEYGENGTTEKLLDWPDWLHAGLVLLPALAPIASAPNERFPGLLRAYTAENGFPELRYSCEFANGADDREQKMGCEETPGVVPGVQWDGVSDATTTHPKPCGKDGINCDGKPCVPANLVFGPESDDDMCILTALVYAPLPDVPPAEACRFRSLD